MTTQTIELKLTRKDFVSDQEVRWCPGCGDYAILAQMQKVMPALNIPRENFAIISGIGCSSRFPYYMNTYGMHSIHGRAPTIATGLAISNPELSVWVITGDGDALSIGGNHFIHVMRRNINLNMVLFNNRIYGLTKGQYSPTSAQGKVTKSSPMGSLEQPINPISLALSAQATFVARSIDAHIKHLGETLEAGAAHQGISFMEVYQNCVIFNPQEWEGWTDRKVRDDHMLYLEHGKPMIFGKNLDKGIVLDGFKPKVVSLENGFSEADLLVHDETSMELAYILAGMAHPEYPTPMGVIRCVERPTYAEGLYAQIDLAKEKKGHTDLLSLYREADLWTVAGETSLIGEMPAGDDEYALAVDQVTPATGSLEDILVDGVLADLNPKTPITVDATTSLANGIQLMNSHGIGCVLVTDDAGILTGIFTEKDILMRIAGKVEDLTAVDVGDYMTTDPIALRADMPIAHAVHLMDDRGFRHLPLVDDNFHPVGVLSFRDVIRYLKQKFE